MKVPALCALLLVAAILILGAVVDQTMTLHSGLATQERSSEPVRSGMVMGRDFTDLLASRHVTLNVTSRDGRVVFEWTSDNPARLAEVLELGHHMQALKKQIEVPEPAVDPSTSVRTANVR